LINRKIYIGQTKHSLAKRASLNGGNYKGSRYFYSAIQKYGWNNFTSEILVDNLSIDEANFWEEYYIKFYDSTNSQIGYNISLGGSNKTMTDETKKIISDKAIERYKDKTKNPMYRKKHTNQTIAKMSEKKVGKNNPMYGIHMSNESKEKRQKTCEERCCTFTHEWTTEERERSSIRFKELAKQWSKRVRCIEDDTIFETITRAAKHYSVSKSTLSGHLNGRQKMCAGKHFEFVINY
jgi:group I intron endonuclease